MTRPHTGKADEPSSGDWEPLACLGLTVALSAYETAGALVDTTTSAKAELLRVSRYLAMRGARAVQDRDDARTRKAAGAEEAWHGPMKADGTQSHSGNKPADRDSERKGARAQAEAGRPAEGDPHCRNDSQATESRKIALERLENPAMAALGPRRSFEKAVGRDASEAVPHVSANPPAPRSDLAYAHTTKGWLKRVGNLVYNSDGVAVTSGRAKRRSAKRHRQYGTPKLSRSRPRRRKRPRKLPAEENGIGRTQPRKLPAEENGIGLKAIYSLSRNLGRTKSLRFPVASRTRRGPALSYTWPPSYKDDLAALYPWRVLHDEALDITWPSTYRDSLGQTHGAPC